ncbi:MAG: hypothetical protein B7Z37_00165 [Verrucomicrobia bacterium 12-59-8]|nr:MAG: hypothetical protein B7Z37_00165 [Verrucomicrobia bacterium 12-59-8]
MIRPLFQTLRLLGISLLAGATWVAHRPAELPKVAAPSTAKADDLIDILRQTTIKRAAVMEISEAEINRHLATTLAGKIPGLIGGWVAFDGARIDLEPDRARLFLVWKVKGYTRTASVDLAISRDDKDFHVELLQGAYGHLQLPRGMMRPLYPSLQALAEALDPEIRALFQMTQITIAKDKLVLDPRFPPA